MALLVNKSQRAYTIGGVMMTPHMPVEIPDDFLNNPRVKQLLKSKQIDHAQKGEKHTKDSRSGRHQHHTHVEPARQGPPTASPRAPTPPPSRSQ